MTKARNLADNALTTVSPTELGYLDGVTSGVQTQLDAKLANALVDAKGDVLTATADNTPARLAVGANDTVLTADSSTATGLKWATPAAGSLTLLSTTSLTGTSTTISSISGAYNNLLIIINNPFFTTGQILQINPNSTAGISIGTKIASGSAGTVANITSSGNGFLPTTSTPNTSFCLQIFNYAQTSNGKNFIFSGNHLSEGMLAGGVIQTTSAITALQFKGESGTPTFGGGTVLIYGVK